jgi:putative oxidoreductase
MTNLFLVGQVILGAYFTFSGLMHFAKGKDMAGWVASKKLPAALPGVYITGVVLALGGVGIMTQMYLPYAYGGLIAFLLIAAVTLHNFWADTNPQTKAVNMVNFQKNIALAAALLMLLVNSLA